MNDASLFSCDPSVFIVNGEYQICALVESECTMWVEIAGRNFYDHSNGILRSGSFVHIAHVPQDLLDGTKSYTVHLRKLNERKPYFTDYGDIESKSCEFHPIREKEEYHVINLADAHSLVEEPIRSGSYFGDKLDLLVMNGDIPNHSDDVRYFKSIYLIAGAITHGQVPCVFSRGNHDMRGRSAECLADYTPTDNGKSYYTFRAGPIWGIVLDVGEDKPDSVSNYGWTICCEAFRQEEDDFIDEVIRRGDYRDASARLVISHAPFSYKRYKGEHFDAKRLHEWREKINLIRPTLMLSGHLHFCYLDPPDGEQAPDGLDCPVVCSSRVQIEPPSSHTSGAILLQRDKVTVRFVNDRSEIEDEVSCPLP